MIGAGAAVENIIPPVPADTFVLFGAFLAAAGKASPWMVFLVTWVPNVGSALLVYALARKWGNAFFSHRIGHWLLHPRQLAQIDRFYQRWGTPAILVSRFLPAFRAMVPVFAGITQVPFWRVALPLAGASALWYGALVWAGALAGRNWEEMVRLFDRVGSVLFGVAAVLIVAFGVWWWRSRRRPDG